jgi:hypothetical protein
MDEDQPMQNEARLTAAEEDAMWDEEDYYEDADDYDDHDEIVGGGGAIGASLSSMVGSEASKKMNLSHAVKNSVAKMHGM